LNKSPNPLKPRHSERSEESRRNKHRYIRPYRSQTNGKIERFWRTIEDDQLRETYFESKEHLQEEILQYINYYNEERAHQGLNGQAPNIFN